MIIIVFRWFSKHDFDQPYLANCEGKFPVAACVQIQCSGILLSYSCDHGLPKLIN